MGSDKAAVVFGSRTLLQRAVDAVAKVASHVVVVGAPGRPLPVVQCARPLLEVSDPVEGEGPLSGIITGLEAAGTPVALIVGCDQPFLRPSLLRLLAERAADHPAVLPVLDGRPQPLCAAVRLAVLPELQAAFARGERAAKLLVSLPGALLLAAEEWRGVDPDGRSFIGVNTPEELERAERLLREFEL
jgi:molybdopterin-guanine dinucleotide biosynthesis protein A